MKLHRRSLLLIVTAFAGCISSALGAPFAFTNGNLILGFQATGGTGSGRNVFVNLGSGTGFRDNGNRGALGNIGTTLASVYGADWYTREDLYFGVIGNLNSNPNTGIGSAAAVNGDPSRTFYLSTAAASPGTGQLIPAGSYPGSSLGSAGSFLNGTELVLLQDPSTGVVGGLQAEADGAAILDSTDQNHASAWNNSWTNWNPVPGASYTVFTGGIQQNFGKGGSSTYVDVQRVLSTNTGASPTGVVGGGTYETTIAISSTGAITSSMSSQTTPFQTWALTFPALDTPEKRLPSADPDNDGLSNLMEFVLNGNPGVSDNSIAPALNASGADFVFSFNRRDDSEAVSTLLFQYGSDLVGWTDVPIGAGNATVGSAALVVVENAAAADAVSVTLPKTVSPSGKLFGRLKVTQP